MDTIISILDDFFYCSRQPIQAIDNNFNLIYKKGLTHDFESIFNKFNIVDIIKSSKDINPFTTVSIGDEYSFLIVPISKFDINKGFYIVGPFKQTTCAKNDNYNLYCINNKCIKYLYNLLTDISDDKFSKGRNKLNFNPYIKKAVEYCIKNYESSITIDKICNELNINKSYFCKLFKSETGYTFTNFLNIFRIEKSKSLLKDTDMSLLDIAISVGFNSQSYYCSVFKKITNKTPLEYKQELKL